MTDETDLSPWEANFVQNMTRRRKALGMSQNALAKALAERGLAFHQPTVQRIEDGLRPVRLNEAVHIVQVLKMGQPGLLGLDHAVYPDSRPALAKLFLVDELQRVERVVLDSEALVFEASDRAFAAIEGLGYSLQQYERTLDREPEEADQALIEQCRRLLEAFTENRNLHPRRDDNG